MNNRPTVSDCLTKHDALCRKLVQGNDSKMNSRGDVDTYLESLDGIGQDLSSVSLEVFEVLAGIEPYPVEYQRADPVSELSFRVEWETYNIDYGLNTKWDDKADIVDFKPWCGCEWHVIAGERVCVFDSKLYAKTTKTVEALTEAQGLKLLLAVELCRLGPFDSNHMWKDRVDFRYKQIQIRRLRE